MDYHQKSLKNRPEFLKHHTPLDLNGKNKENVVKYPKIIARGALSLATPVNESKNYKNISDTIGSNYTPSAKHLSIKFIGDVFSHEENKNKLKTRSNLFSNKTLSTSSFTSIGSNKKTNNSYIKLPRIENSNVRQSRSRKVSSDRQTIYNDHSLSPLPNSRQKKLREKIKSTSGYFTKQNISSIRSTLFDLNDDDDDYEPNKKIEKLFSLISKSHPNLNYVNKRKAKFQSEKSSSIFNYENSNVNFQLTKSQIDTLNSESIKSFDKFITRRYSIKRITYKDFDDENEYMNHDDVTLKVLNFDFQTWDMSTPGLTRPNSPETTSRENYYRLINECINKNMLFELPDEIFENIIERVNKRLLIESKQSTISLFKKDLIENYFWSIKKSILDYLLKESDEQKRLGLKLINKIKKSTDRLMCPWHDSYFFNKELLESNFFVTTEISKQLFYLSKKFYSHKKMINLEYLKTLMPITLSDFKTTVQNELDISKNIFNDNWLQECANIISENKHIIEAIYNKSNGDRTEIFNNFFNSISALMASIMREVIENTLNDLILFMNQYIEGNEYQGEYDIFKGLAIPHLITPFKLYLMPDREKSQPKIEPSLDEFISELNVIIDSIVNSFNEIPRIEKLLFQNMNHIDLKYHNMVNMNDDIVIKCKSTLKSIVLGNSTGPEIYQHTYDYYKYINSNAVIEDIDKFLKKDKSLKDYQKKIEYLKNYINKVAKLPDNVPMNFFLIDCSKINEWISYESQKYVDKILEKISTNNLKFNRYICERFDKIAAQMTKHTSTPDECVEAIKFIENLKLNEIFELKDLIYTSALNILFFLDYGFFTNEELRWNTHTLTWYDNIQPIIASTEMILLRQKDLWISRTKQKSSKLFLKINDILTRVKEFKQRDKITEAETILKDLEKIKEEIDECLKEKSTINYEEKILDFEELTDFSIIQEIILIKEPFDKLWSTGVELSNANEIWMNKPIGTINAGDIENEVQKMWKLSYRLTKQFRTADTKGPLKVAATLKARLERFKINLPLINALCNPGLNSRHWNEIDKLLDEDVLPNKETSLRELLKNSKSIEKNLDKLTEISELASKEHALEEALIKMKTDWESINFTLVTYKDTDVMILSSFDEIQAILDDHIVKTNTMKNSPFVQPFEEFVIKWHNELNQMQIFLDCWTKVQSSWIYLEPIFGSADIRSQMAEEGELFENIDIIWKKMMNEKNLKSNALDFLLNEEILLNLQNSIEMLEKIHKGLSEYLEKKRLYFPRFYFMSNDELLEILSETKDPLKVEPYLKNCFEGIKKLVYNENDEIEAMQSTELENVKFLRNINPSEARGLVEKWLKKVEDMMRLSLETETIKAFDKYKSTELEEWITLFPGQIVLIVNSVIWTSEATNSIINQSLKDYLDLSNNRLEKIVLMVRGELNKMTRISLEALIVINVHARDVVEFLYDSKTSNPQDFNWTSQLRYYLEEKRIHVKMITTSIPYSYEYLGNTNRLVITPLTDRCYRTIMSAIQLNLGSALEGPAGTGKTETSKDLAKAVAKQCVVFNCSDGIDYKGMSKFFKGLAQSGAWTCFDEFNRIEIEVLSVIAQQIQTIQRAISDQKSLFNFEGSEISLDNTCTIFITMNPGYSGRSELPDNLKALFRPIAMMIPDYQLIAEISLYSMGFVKARNLASKITTTYKLCSEQLSSQPHYHKKFYS